MNRRSRGPTLGGRRNDPPLEISAGGGDDLSRNVRFYVRPGCHLCDDARPLVARAATATGFGIDEIDVDADPATAVDYGLRIPVVEGPSGRILAEGIIDWRPLIREMRRERG
jgi:hypothetical protein